jgi:hypothetical protein
MNYPLRHRVKAHIFVDECKVRGLLLAAAVVPPSELAPLRKVLSRLRLPGQRRIHFLLKARHGKRSSCVP